MEKKVIKKENWVANFTLIGKPVINDYTYKIDERSEKSNWVYNALNLGVDCGEKHGVVYSEAMSGYSEDNENKIFAHGKKDDGSDDFEAQIIVDWEDRFNDSVLEEIGDLSFVTVGLEKTSEGKTFYKKFLSMYDAIAYIKEHLTEDMVVNVKGNTKYSPYNENVQTRKNITSIVLSKVTDPADFKATFTQTILIDEDSFDLTNNDKDKGVVFVNARVLDYIKEVNGVEVKGQYPFKKTFEFKLDLENEKQCEAIKEKLFKVKTGITQITFEGEFVEGGAVITATWDDVPNDIKDLVDMGVYTKEEALAKCTVNGGRERRMVLTKPQIKLVGDDKVPVIQKFEEKFTEEDLYLDYVFESAKETKSIKKESKAEETVEENTDNSMDWLNAL